MSIYSYKSLMVNLIAIFIKSSQEEENLFMFDIPFPVK